MHDAPLHPDEQQPVIVADADAKNARHVERQLRRAGVENPVVKFQNGDDLHTFLVETAQKDTPIPCVLFLDPRMPGANGYDPVRWVRREKCGTDMLFAIFSSPDELDEVEIAGGLGVNLFLKKYPDLSSLSPVIDHLGGRRPAETSSEPELPAAPAK
jgi:CheY-like chemotaxis protein